MALTFAERRITRLYTGNQWRSDYQPTLGRRAGEKGMLYDISYRASGPRKGQLKIVLDELSVAEAKHFAELLRTESMFAGVIRSCENETRS